MPLFEVAVIQHATKKEIEAGDLPEKLVMKPKLVLAKDRETAGLMGLTQDPTELAGIDLNRAQVLIRPFA